VVRPAAQRRPPSGARPESARALPVLVSARPESDAARVRSQRRAGRRGAGTGDGCGCGTVTGDGAEPEAALARGPDRPTRS